MPSLIRSQESFNDVLPSVLEKRASPKPQLQTERLKHITLDSGGDSVDGNEELLQMISKQINKSRKVMVLTGAGISCNAGIPDFRSSDGLYSLVKKKYPDVQIRSGQDMFDISLFQEEEKISVFATFMDSLHSSTIMAKPTRTHEFIAHLKNKKRLLRCYTQNIDGLEEQLGLEMSRNLDQSSSFNSQWKSFDVVQLHGDLNSLSCTQCFKAFNWSRSWKRILKNGALPPCPRCHEFNQQRTSQGKRLRNNVGILRPNIVLYGENHPSCELITHGLNMDIAKGKPDLLIIMGTSLKVDGVKKLVKSISKQVHERSGIVLLINNTNIGDCNWHGIIDYQLVSDCDEWVSDLKKRIPEFFLSQQQVDKLRQLKREASELRKKQREEKKQLQSVELETKQTPNTPPTTPSPTKRKHGSINIAPLEIDGLKSVVIEPADTDILRGPQMDVNTSGISCNKVFMKLVKDDREYEKLSELSHSDLLENSFKTQNHRSPKRMHLSTAGILNEFSEIPTELDETQQHLTAIRNNS
ncbi:NAD-dependent histone deacetylase HST3 Ecym_5587 [Eremothecium cymbalariae DBVPG|uniref:Deacetylase sirtuin-type domain-containing protein n=1 Tax=Eremothecium cymbalariae (strain CBS 270.75 / DBVPG 7215 / KCTC 17166 / NRRL Y-17582) TaxID=931890 RepID=I6NE33_ERECY|nr:hypothetical protein Ecym_5587 [Eremothecium cymbalariae DBVPG\